MAALEAGCSGFILIVSNISATMDLLLSAARRTVQRQSRKYIAILQPDSDGTLDGTEGRLIIELSRQLNFSWSIVTDEFQWGEIQEDASGNGILGTVSEDRADFGFGALYLWYHEYQFVDFSTPYIRTGITCLAPRPSLLSGWRAPALPFSAKLWLVVTGSLVLSATLVCLCANLQRFAARWIHGTTSSSVVERLCRPTESVLLVLGMSVLAPPPSLPVNATALKHCLNWLLIQRKLTRQFGLIRAQCLLLATCYASSLVSFMTVPQYATPIDTAADLARRGLHWAATHDAWAFSLREASDPVHSKVYQLFLELDEATLAREATRGKLAFSVERLPAGHFAVGDYVATEQALDKLRLMGQDLYWEMVVTVVRKGSPYLAHLDRLIHRLMASGILLHWEGEVARKFLSSRHQLAIKNSHSRGETQGPIVLTIHHVQGVFLILAAGLTLATLTFGLEVIRHRSIALIN
ncbi:hypothetical protein B566_EDAN005107 [Ephemera danica]|nr:hypothetical protein B566_EDAN005107 [Ephemera danica]